MYTQTYRKPNPKGKRLRANIGNDIIICLNLTLRLKSVGDNFGVVAALDCDVFVSVAAAAVGGGVGGKIVQLAYFVFNAAIV